MEVIFSCSSWLASPMPMLDNGNTASDEVKVTQVVDLTRSKSRLNMKGATESKDFQSNGNFASQDMDNGIVHEVNRVEAEPVENQLTWWRQSGECMLHPSDLVLRIAFEDLGRLVLKFSTRSSIDWLVIS
jgi:hypothetical protein